MKITIYGAGNQRLQLNKLNVPEKFGGNPPYGGAAMAIQMAKAGHSVVLAEPNKENLTEEHWKIVENAGVKVISDDIEGAKHGEIHILFTPYGKLTVKIVKNIIEHLPENSIICTTCTMIPVVLYKLLQKEFKLKRKDISLSTFHPAGVPGSDTQQQYIIGKNSNVNTNDYISDENINKLVELCKSINKEPKVIPISLTTTIGGMVICNVLPIIDSIVEFYKVGIEELDMPEKMIDDQVLFALNTLSTIIYTNGIKGLVNTMDHQVGIDTIKHSAINMMLNKEKQPIFKDSLEELDKEQEFFKKLSDEYNDEIKPYNNDISLAVFDIYEEIKKILGDKPAEGIVNRAIKTKFSHYEIS